MERFKTKAEATAYLAGMFDGEGSVCMSRRGEAWAGRSIRISNTELALLEACIEACERLGIEASIYTFTSHSQQYHGKKTSHDLVICKRASLEQFLKVVPFQSQPKRERLTIAVESYVQNWVPITEIDGERLRRLYWDDGLSLQAIAILDRVSYGAIRDRMKKKGIPRRPTGWNFMQTAQQQALQQPPPGGPPGALPQR